MNKISLLAFSAVAFVGCSVEAVEELIAPSSGKELTVSASFGSADTRIGIEQDDQNTWNFKWQSDDMLGARFDDAAVSASVPFYIQEGFHDNVADFKGVVPVDAQNVVFTYPNSVSDFDLRNQIVVFDDEHKALNAYGEYHVVLTSEEIAVSKLEDGTITDIPLSAKYTAIELKITGSALVNGVITKAIMSYTSGGATTTTKLSVTNAPALSADAVLLLPFSYEPFTTAAGDSFTITCVFDDSKVATFTKSDVPADVDFKAGTHNYMKATFFEYTTTGVSERAIIEYTETDYPAAGTDIWVVTDVTIDSKDSYGGLKAALNAAKDAGRTIEVVFPNLITVVEYAFSDCDDLTSISLTKAQSIGREAFYCCANLTSISLPKANKFAYKSIYKCTSLTSISLPAAKTFGESTFSKCTSLSSISLPAAETFGGYAFYGCSNLTSISLPAAETFGYYAFGGCSNLTSISLPAAETFGYYAFYGCSNLTTISLPEATEFGNTAFGDCSNLTTISLPKAQTFGGWAFEDCSNLTTISLPEATEFGDSAFEGCSNLTSVSLPKAQTFGCWAFYGCSNLTNLSLGENGDGVSLIDSCFCLGASPANIDLTIKLAPESNCTISNKTLTVDGTDDYTFKSITQK